MTSSIRELKDTEIYIQFLKDYYGNPLDDYYQNLGEDDELVRPHRPPNRSSFLDNFKRSTLIVLARTGTITNHQMAMNLEFEFLGENRIEKMIFPNEPIEKIEMVSFNYIDRFYDEHIKVLTTTCKFLAYELAAHPQIRSYVRNQIFAVATISTQPTKKGITELDAFNESYRTKRINKRPIDGFQNDLFIDVVENEKKKLITVSINIEDDKLNFITEKLKMAYIRPRINSNFNNEKEDDVLKGWNQFREEVIQKLVFEILLPEIKTDIRNYLFEKAESFIINECGTNFSKLLMTGPYRKRVNSLFEDPTPTVMSFVYDNVQSKVRILL